MKKYLWGSSQTKGARMNWRVSITSANSVDIGVSAYLCISLIGLLSESNSLSLKAKLSSYFSSDCASFALNVSKKFYTL